ncbi:hypothetical protein [Sorangium sp. So ce1024]|uniref:hypothetical protein n=1 Tax=Sorangium sp. So ce1024 TaxID=3133327 RepID=UPI003F097524
MTRADQIRTDADEVLTSAPLLAAIPAAWDPEQTWDGSEDEPAPPSAARAAGRTSVEARATRVAELEDALTGARERAAALERLLQNAEARVLLHAGRADAAEGRLCELMTRGLDAAPLAELRAAIARREQQISLGGARGDGPEATRSGAPVSPPAREPSSPPGPGAAVGLGGAL